MCKMFSGSMITVAISGLLLGAVSLSVVETQGTKDAHEIGCTGIVVSNHGSSMAHGHLSISRRRSSML